MCYWGTDAGSSSVRDGRSGKKEIVWHYDTPSVVFFYGNGTKDRSIGVIDLPCVVGGQNMQIKMHVVPREVPCLLSKSWLKENGAVLNTSSEELLLTKKQITALCLRVQAAILNLTCVQERRILARVGPEP